MLHRKLRGAILALVLFLPKGQAHAESPPEVTFSIIRTGEARPPEALVVSGGRWFQRSRINHSAFLVRHGQDAFLFDTGLGKEVEAQVSADMPWWARPFFSFTPGASVLSQLADKGLTPPGLIILSHAHWDHASGLEDLPGAQVLATSEEIAFSAGRHPGSVFPSQFSTLAGRWRIPEFNGPEVEGYGLGLDLYGDGSVVLIRMPGHTPGAIGMLLKTSDGRRYLFPGDTVWSTAGLDRAAPRFFLASLIVDNDRRRANEQVARLTRFHLAHPEVVIIPSHDGQVQQQLGYFPVWIGR